MNLNYKGNPVRKRKLDSPDAWEGNDSFVSEIEEPHIIKYLTFSS